MLDIKNSPCQFIYMLPEPKMVQFSKINSSLMSKHQISNKKKAAGSKEPAAELNPKVIFYFIYLLKL